MSYKITIVLMLAGVSLVQSIGTIVTLGGALTVPLLTAPAGTIGTALAALGALKLGAAAWYLKGAALLGKFRGEEDSGYGYEAASPGYSAPHYRAKRSEMTQALGTDPDALFSLISSLDLNGCGKQLICELEAKDYHELQSDELLMLSLFGGRKRKDKKVNPASPKAEYDLAADLGLASKSQLVCRNRYSSCPYTGEEMMTALRQSHI